ncbi:MAG: methionine--tRNA ligase [Mucinivorans sp.]
MSSNKTLTMRYLVTSALPYANGGVHIGHLAGVYIPSDIYTRYLRLRGEEVIHVCGSDEHGVPITLKAKKEGVSPQAIVDRYNTIIKDSFEKFGIAFDIYSRTSSATHAQTASDFFRHLYEKGEFVEQVSEQYFDPEASQFLADRYITGDCPKCGAPGAYGDQCEKCGSTLSPLELKNPKSMISGAVPVLKETRHWYLPLDKHEAFLRQWILEEHKEWKPNVYGQCKSWLDGGLMPRAVSRDLDWGIPVPVEGAQGKVLYVWFDAPIGYISATKDLTPEWEKYWKDPSTKMIHFIGKDNIVFHCIVFPAMLRAHGGYNLPENVPANEFLNLEGDKISTSRGWAVWLDEYLVDFPNQQDVLRYALCASAPETKDNDFTWRDFQQRNNSELVAIFGNFVNRALVLTAKYFDNKVPSASVLSRADSDTLAQIGVQRKAVEHNIETYHFREALFEVMNIARLGNKYLTENEPWKTIKTDPERTGVVLNVALQIVASMAIAAEPFLPFTADKILSMIGVKSFAWGDLGRNDLLAPGHPLGQAELLFSKIEDEQIEAQIAKLQAIKAAALEASQPAAQIVAPLAAPQKEIITYDDFAKLDLRVGKVLRCEKVEKSDKLLKFTIDTGLDERTIVSGVAGNFTPEELVGRNVTVLMNLAPRKLCGVESQGMLLFAGDPAGEEFTNLAPDKELKAGTAIS